MTENSIFSRRRQNGIPILLIIVCSLVIAYCTFFSATTFESIEANKNKSPSGMIQNAIWKKNDSDSGASDKTYKNTGNDDCKSFDHGDTSPTDPEIHSIFNCNSKYGKCKWHFPAKFFDASCGVGREYANEKEILRQKHENWTLWLDGPPIVIPWASITPQTTAHTFRKEPYPVHNLSMTHVHKTGGTSLVNAFGSILTRGARGKRHLVYMPHKSNPRVIRDRGGKKLPPISPRSINSTSSYQAADKFLNGAVKYKSEWGLYDHTLFAVIRDPAERFISAIGQATGAFGSSTNGIGSKLLSECLKKNSKDTLTCFVDLVQNNGTLIEVHFTPMVFEISFATMWKDIPVAVFPFQDVPSLLNEVGANPAVKKKDGHKAGYRKDPVLTNMTSADYDVDSLTKLCEIYWVDVLFLNHIGYKSNCDWILHGTEFKGIEKEEGPRPVEPIVTL